MTLGSPRLAHRSAVALARAGADARLRMADTSDRFVRRFVDVWLLFGATLWLALYLMLPAVQYPGALMVMAGLGAKGALLRGRSHLARYLIVGLWSLFVLFTPMLLNGIRTPVLLSMAPLLMMAGWLLGRRVLIALTALFVCGVAAYWLAETRGWLVLTVPLRSADVWAMVHATVIGFTGFMVWSFVSSYEASYGIEMDLQRQLAAALGQAEKANQELAAVLRFNETIVRHSPLPIGVYAADGRCVEANEAYARMVGTSRAKLMTYNFHQIDKWRESGLLEQALLSLGDGQPRRVEGAVLTAFGRDISGECHIMVTELNGQRHLLVQFLDLTERKRLEQELRMMAFYDALTQLPNRRLLLDRLKQAIYTSKRHSSYAAILFLDLNKFKLLNDTHGHDAGDQLLVKVARRLRALVRQADTVARLGGDEFVVLIEELGADAAAAQHHVAAVADKVTRILNQEYQLGELHYSCTISIGWHLFCGDQSDPDEILKHADTAMYLAKRNAA
jgi:diguanylate cyclase (GGDEF)-like protein/PAS domain S-box-containing protein